MSNSRVQDSLPLSDWQCFWSRKRERRLSILAVALADPRGGLPKDSIAGLLASTSRLNCEAARQLNVRSGMNDWVEIHEGSALALPLLDGSIDRAYSQFVVMNIKEKFGVYREAARVLKPNGLLVLCHVGA